MLEKSFKSVGFISWINSGQSLGPSMSSFWIGNVFCVFYG